MKNFFHILLWLLVSRSFSQVNLVPNPSFENYSRCPTGLSQLSYSKPWYVPSCGTSDFYDSCATIKSYANVPYTYAGYSYAYSGSGMAGFCPMGDPFNVQLDANYREYLAVKLTSQLLVNQRYYVSFFVKLSSGSRFAIHSIGVYFSKDSINKPNGCDTITATPQVINSPINFVSSKTNWTQIKGNFISSGKEKHMYIGNFSPTVTNDTLTVSLIPPPVNMPYAVLTSYYYVDNICVSTDENYCDTWTGVNDLNYESGFNIYPNPVIEKMTLELKSITGNDKLICYDSMGSKVFEMSLLNATEEIDLSFLKSGFYYLKLRNNTGQKVFKISKN